MSQNVLTIKTVQISPFRTLMTALKDILLEANITFQPDGMRIINMDRSHTILVHLFLRAENFEMYECKYDKIIIEKKLEDYKNFIYNIGYLYFIMISYKNYTFQKYILTLNNKKCFILSQLFEILNYISYFEFSYEKEKIKSPFFLDYIKLVIYRTHYQWKGIFMKHIKKNEK